MQYKVVNPDNTQIQYVGCIYILCVYMYLTIIVIGKDYQLEGSMKGLKGEHFVWAKGEM